MPESQYEFKTFKYSSHDRILNALRGEKEPVRILDAGTAGGYLGKVWRNDGHYVAGIEFDAATGEKARQYYDEFEIANLETYPFSTHREFDYIVFADVLEHLRDPAAVLHRCIPALKPTGKIIISVPNIANWIIRLSLLFGKFDYRDRGILDRTHLRFFTSRSVKQLMKEVSCEVQEIIATPVPVQLVFPFTESKIFAPLHELHYAITRAWKSLFAYQFVIVAAPTAGAASRESDNRSADARVAEKELVSR
jgi:SAM-dependent methyltransferase